MILKKIALFFVLALFSSAMFCQQDDFSLRLAAQLDSIKNNISTIEERNVYYEELKSLTTEELKIEIIAFQGRDNIFSESYIVARAQFEFLLKNAEFAFLEKNEVHYFLGYIYLIGNELSESIEFYNIILSNYKDEQLKNMCRIYIATLYVALNEYELALGVLENAKMETEEAQFGVFSEMAIIHNHLGNIKKAKLYLDSAAMKTTLIKNQNVLKFTLATFEFREGNFQKSVELYQEVIGNSVNRDYHKAYNNLSLAYQRLNDDRAISCADSALVILRNELGNKPYGFEYSVSYQNKAEYYSIQGLHELSINLIDSAIYNHCYGSSIKGSPNKYKIDPLLLDDKMTLVDFLDVKIGILKAAKDSLKLESTYWLMDTIIQAIREERYDDQGRYFQQSQLSKYYKDAVQHFINSGDERTAYLFTQKMKNIILLENRHFRRANSFLSDSLRTRIDFLKEGIRDLASIEIGESKNDSIKFEIEKLKLTLIKTRNSINRENPVYYGFRFQESSARIEDLQEACKDNQLIIDYYLEDSILHIFAISKNDFNTYSQELRGGAFAEINGLLEEISKKPRFLSYTDLECERLNGRLHELYELLIPFSIQKFDQLLIFPSEQISYLPLEALVNKPSNRNCPYLVCSKAISYSFSPQLWLLAKGKNMNGKNNSLIFSPHQTAQNSELYLPFAKMETESIAKIFESKVETECKKDSFFTILQKYNVHHLLSHAIIDLEDPNKSFFHMGDEVDSISMEDIVNTNLESKMVCLSACDTGNGKYVQGEGILSLARSFIVSGASSVVMSNFKVSDRSGAKIMANFYGNLSLGMNKSKALSNSKRDYLQSESLYKRHPYFWSSFTLQGNDAAIINKRSNTVTWLIISISVMLILLFGLNGIRSYRSRL